MGKAPPQTQGIATALELHSLDPGLVSREGEEATKRLQVEGEDRRCLRLEKRGS